MTPRTFPSGALLWSPPRSRRPTPSSPRPAGGARTSSTAPRRWPWPRRAWTSSPWRVRTARPRPRACSPRPSRRPEPTPPSPSAGSCGPWAPAPTWAADPPWSPRPMSPTAPSSTTPRAWRSSPTSSPTTSTATAPRRPSRRHSSTSLTGWCPGACWSPAPPTPAHCAWRSPLQPRACASSHTPSQAPTPSPAECSWGRGTSTWTSRNVGPHPLGGC